MPAMTIHLEGDNCWPDLKEHPDRLIPAQVTSVAALPNGMTSGRASVAFRIDLPDGRTVIAETSMLLFLGAARAFVARYGEEAGR